MDEPRASGRSGGVRVLGAARCVLRTADGSQGRVTVKLTRIGLDADDA